MNTPNIPNKLTITKMTTQEQIEKLLKKWNPVEKQMFRDDLELLAAIANKEGYIEAVKTVQEA